MNFETIEGILNINLNSTMTLALAAVLLIMGYSINKRLSILNKYCIPAPVVGGFIFIIYISYIFILLKSSLVLKYMKRRLILASFFTYCDVRI